MYCVHGASLFDLLVPAVLACDSYLFVFVWVIPLHLPGVIVVVKLVYVQINVYVLLHWLGPV